MHYIRLLRPPTVESSGPRKTLRIVLTITTDLGDSFLSVQEPIALTVVATNTAKSEGPQSLVPVYLTGKDNPTWRAGQRVLKLELPLPASPLTTIQIRPASKELAALCTDAIFAGDQGLIVPVYADLPRPNEEMRHVSFRNIRIGSRVASFEGMVQVEEEIGESIARHVWDAGMVTVSMFSCLCLRNRATDKLRDLLAILETRHPVSILELGCGVGVLGIGIAHVMRCMPGSGPTHVLMTDLPEAEERAQANIARFRAQVHDDGDQNVELQYENLDWEEGKDGHFGPLVTAKPWDLIVLSDCTYNVDMLPTLVRTLTALHTASMAHAVTHEEGLKGSYTSPRILLALKPRHESESALWSLMDDAGWSIAEKTSLKLPSLDEEMQQVIIILFQHSSTYR